MSDNITPEPERILLHADWSTTRHGQPTPDDVAEHERRRREKLRREREPFVPPPSPKAADRLMDAEVAEHAERTVEFLIRYEIALATTDDASAGPVRPDEEATT